MTRPVGVEMPKATPGPALPGEPKVTRYRTWLCVPCQEEFEKVAEIRAHLKRRHKISKLFGVKERTSYKPYGRHGHTEVWAWHVDGVNLFENIVETVT